MAIRNMPLVCICIPTYNNANTIGKTLNSLINQTYKNIKIKVVNNNSTDDTISIVQSFAKKDERVELYNYDNLVEAALNFDRCIDLADGDYTCIFHSDDMYLPNIIEREVSFLEKYKDVGAVFTYGYIIDKDDNIISEFSPKKELTKKNIYGYEEILPLTAKYGNLFVTPTAMLRTDVYKNTVKKHKIKESFGDAFDADVWLRVSKKYKVGFVFEKLIKYRSSMNSLSYRKVLLYKNTVEDGFCNVLIEHVETEGNINVIDYNKYYNLLLQNTLKNAFLACMNRDYAFAKFLIQDIEIKNISRRNFFRLIKIKLLVHLHLPYVVRKYLVYKKHKNVFKNNFDKIELN